MEGEVHAPLLHILLGTVFYGCCEYLCVKLGTKDYIGNKKRNVINCKNKVATNGGSFSKIIRRNS